jgi:hypothetical protein
MEQASHSTTRQLYDFCGNGNETRELGTEFFAYKRITSALKECRIDRTLYIILLHGGDWTWGLD